MKGLKFIWNTEEYNSKDLQFVEDSLNVFSKALVSISDNDLYTYQAHQSEDYNILVYGYQSLKFDENFHQILSMIYQEGVNSVFDGDFPYLIIVEDLRNDTFLFLRDHVGALNAFYYQDNKRFVFSTNVHSILNIGYSDKKISNIAFEDFLRYGIVQEPNTLLDDVFVLPKSSMITLNEENTEFYQFNPILEQKNNFLISSLEDCKRVLFSLIENDLKHKTLVLNKQEDYRFYDFLKANNIQVKTKKFSDIISSFNANDLLKIIEDLDFPSEESFVASILKSEEQNDFVFASGFYNLIGKGYIFDKAKLIEANKWFVSFPPPVKKLYGKVLNVFKPSENSKNIQELLLQDYFELPDYFKLNNALFYDAEFNEELSSKCTTPNLVLDSLKTNLAYGKKGYTISLSSKILWSQWFTSISLKQSSFYQNFGFSTPLLQAKVLNLFLHLDDSIKEELNKELIKCDSSYKNIDEIDLSTIFSSNKTIEINKKNPIVFNNSKEHLRGYKNKKISLTLLKKWLDINKIK